MDSVVEPAFIYASKLQTGRDLTDWLVEMVGERRTMDKLSSLMENTYAGHPVGQLADLSFANYS